MAAGDPGISRCQIDNELQGHDTGPDTYLPQKGAQPVRVQHFSFLAFLRFFYRRLLARRAVCAASE